MKLSNKEKQLVKEYAKKLVERSSADYVFFTISNEKLDDILQQNALSTLLDYDEDSKGNEVYKLPIRFADKFEDFAQSHGFEADEDYQILDNFKFESKKIKGKKIIKEQNLTNQSEFETYVNDNIDDIIKNALTYGFDNPRKIAKIKNPYDFSNILGCDSRIFRHADLQPYAEILADLIEQETINRHIAGMKESTNPNKKILKENNTYTMISALREIADDLLLQTELLIDNQYGKLEHNQFKNAWYKNANEFEKKFNTIIKSLMKAGK